MKLKVSRHPKTSTTIGTTINPMNRPNTAIKFMGVVGMDSPDLIAGQKMAFHAPRNGTGRKAK
jgi:hypothetical protein